MTTREQEPDGAHGELDALAELDALVELGRRAPGSDAERRVARHLQARLEALGREAETESFAIYPGWPLGYAALAALTVAGSVLAVYSAVAGAALALAAAILTLVDAGYQVPTLRRLLGRRASQNVVSWERDAVDKPGSLLLVAHCDASRGGLALSASTARRRAALGALLRRPLGGLEPLLWAELGVFACCVLRLVGLDGTALTVVQLVPTTVLLAAIALLLDAALAGTRAGEDDNASGVVLGLRLAQRLGPNALEHFAVHVVFTGAQKAGGAGMRAFVAGHDLPADRTVVLNLDSVGSGDVRYTRREGALLTIRSHDQLLALCEQIVEDDDPEHGYRAGPLVSRAASDAYSARAAGLPAITVTCRERLDYSSGRVDERVLARAEGFCAELAERLDAEVGPQLSPREAT